jgi:uncharacterized membrane protein YqjE
MMNGENNFGGLIGSVRRVVDTGISIVKNRVELATLELKEEKSRLISAAVWGGIFLFSSFMALVAVACTALFVFWDQRLYVAVGLLIFCIIGALVGLFLLKRGVKAPLPFSETIAQFKKDRTWLRGRN